MLQVSTKKYFNYLFLACWIRNELFYLDSEFYIHARQTDWKQTVGSSSQWWASNVLHLLCGVHQECKALTIDIQGQISGLFSVSNSVSSREKGLFTAYYKMVGTPKLSVPWLQCKPTACNIYQGPATSFPWALGRRGDMAPICSCCLLCYE